MSLGLPATLPPTPNAEGKAEGTKVPGAFWCCGVALSGPRSPNLCVAPACRAEHREVKLWASTARCCQGHRTFGCGSQRGNLR